MTEKGKAAADGGRQRPEVHGGTNRNPLFAHHADYVNPSRIEVVACSRTWRFPWTAEDEILIVSACEDAPVWYTRDAVFVYYREPRWPA